VPDRALQVCRRNGAQPQGFIREVQNMSYRGSRSSYRGSYRSSGSGYSGRSSSGFQTRTNSSGYRQYRTAGGSWQFTHRAVAAKQIGGSIPRNCQVHHVNGVKTDNRPSNLRVLPTVVHRLIHKKGG